MFEEGWKEGEKGVRQEREKEEREGEVIEKINQDILVTDFGFLRKRERERKCVCVCERERERERECVCVSVERILIMRLIGETFNQA